MVDLAGWVASLDAVVTMIASRFPRAEPRVRVGAYLRGLLAGLERKNGWTLAEHAGAVSPDGMQRLLRTASWDVDGVRDDLRGYVLDGLGDASGVWVIDETGFIKKGRRSAGVQRQYTGTTGKIDNCQLGVFLTYASTTGRALVDRELYLPTSWTDDPDRCADAGVPADVEFATKPELGVAMLERAHDAGAMSAQHGNWVTADEAYGQNRAFRVWLARHALPFVLATRSDDRLTCPDGRTHRAAGLAGLVPAHGWQRRSAGDGAHGPREYDWAVITLRGPGDKPGDKPGDNPDDADELPAGWGHWLLVRRQILNPPDRTQGKAPELTFYRCAAPETTLVAELIRVAGARWAIEETFQTAKNEAGLDHYQARHYQAWYRHITLAMLATAYLAVTRAEAKRGAPDPTTDPKRDSSTSPATKSDASSSASP